MNLQSLRRLPLCGRRAALALGLAAMAALLAGCGEVGTDPTKAQVRLVNASAYDELDLRVNDAVVQGGVAHGESVGYAALDPGNRRLQVTQSGSATPLLSLDMNLARNRHNSLLAWGRVGALNHQWLDDEQASLDNNRHTLRVFNAAPDAGALDVYLTDTADGLPTAVPVVAGTAVGALSTAQAVDARTWRLRVTAAGSKTDLRLDLPALTLSARDVATLVLTPTRGGTLVGALLVVQRAGVERHGNTQARVRVVAGVAQGGAVSATVGGQVLMGSVGSPAVGLYQLVAAGTQPVALSVNGAALSSPEVVLEAGADHTLLVRGVPAAPLASWLLDDNRLALDSNAARVRLVHGLADFAGSVSMTVDFVPAADGVAPGTGSGYAEFAATTTARVTVNGLGLPAPLFDAVEQRLDAAGVYSVFIVGPQAAPVGILRKDR